MKKEQKKISGYIMTVFVCILLIATNSITVKASVSKEKPTKLLLEKSEMVCKVGDDLWIDVDKTNTMPQNANKTMNWETSDATVVTVDHSYDGMETCHISTKKAGTAVITGTSVVDKNIKVKCIINVLEGQYSSGGVWVLDKAGNLTVIDKGYVYDERDKVKKAKVIVTEKCTGLEELFYNYSNLIQVEFIVKNSSNVTNMQQTPEDPVTLDVPKLPVSGFR